MLTGPECGTPICRQVRGRAVIQITAMSPFPTRATVRGYRHPFAFETSAVSKSLPPDSWALERLLRLRSALHFATTEPLLLSALCHWPEEISAVRCGRSKGRNCRSSSVFNSSRHGEAITDISPASSIMRASALDPTGPRIRIATYRDPLACVGNICPERACRQGSSQAKARSSEP